MTIVLVTNKVFRGEELDLRHFNWHFLRNGLIYTIILVGFHLISLIWKGINPLVAENLAVDQHKSIRSITQKYELLNDLVEDRKFGKMFITSDDHSIQLVKDKFWKAWGEKISIEIKSIGGDIFEYEVSSSPRRRFIMVDMGRNFQNVKRIAGFLKAV
ncbi:MAG: hypothetical protein ABIV51_05640 [Saprospiraceae bacterium]